MHSSNRARPRAVAFARKFDFLLRLPLDQEVSCLVPRPTNRCNLDPEGAQALAAGRDFPFPVVKK
jgi:hypothetical protein